MWFILKPNNLFYQIKLSVQYRSQLPSLKFEY